MPVPVGQDPLGLHRGGRHEPPVEDVGRRAVHRPPQREVEPPLPELLEPGAEVGVLDGRVDPDGLEAAGDDLRGPDPVGVAGHGEDLVLPGAAVGHSPDPVRAPLEAGLVEQRVGGGHVVPGPGPAGGDLRILPARVGVAEPGGVGGAGVAVEGDVDHQLPVDGHADGLAHAHVVEGRAPGVGVEEDGPAHEREPVPVVLGVPLHEDPVDGRDEAARPVHLVEHQRQVGALVARVGRAPQRVHLRLSRLPVVGVAPQLVDLVLEDADLGERASPHRVLVGEGDGILDAAPDVLGDDGDRGQVVEAGDEHLLELEVDGVSVDDADVLEEAPDAAPVEGRELLQQLEGEGHVPRAEGGAVGPPDPLPCLHPQHAVAGLPGVAHRQPGDVLPLHGVEHQHGLVDAGLGRPALRASRRERIEVPDPGGLLLLGDHQRAARRRLPLLRAPGQGQGGEEEGDRRGAVHLESW